MKECHVGQRVLTPERMGTESDLQEGTVTKIGQKGKLLEPARVIVRLDDRRSVVRSMSDLQEIPHPSTQVPLDDVVALRDAPTAALPPEWEARRIENSPESIVVTHEGKSWLVWVEACV
jgi:hypothetical protein